MRTIKFRVWNGEQMVSPDFIDRQGYAHWKEHSIPNSTKKLMQFTGLLDKNGKEIYEGDICILHLPPMDDIKKEPRQVVFKWHRNGWYLDGFNHLYGTYYFGGIQGVMLEIIGNIHQNPELL